MIEDLSLFENYLYASVVAVVLLSEVTKFFFKKNSFLAKAKGFWFLLPLIYSFLTVLAMHLGGEGVWKGYVSDCIKVYGISTFLYESIAKRLFKVIGAENVTDSNCMSSFDSGISSDHSYTSENPEEPSVETSEGARRISEVER